MEKVTIKDFNPNLPLDRIEVAEENVRKTKQTLGLEELMSSIDKFGLIHPIVVIHEKGKYKVIVGQRRYLAFKGLGKSTIPAIVIDSLDTTSQKIVSLGENIHRSELPYEDTIQVCDALYNKYQGSKTERVRKIAKDLGVSTSTVSKYLAHRLVPPPVRELVQEKKLSDDVAYRITTSFWPDEKKIVDIAKRSTRLTKSERDRVLEMGAKKPAASVEEVITNAKTPRPVYELIIHLESETGKKLERYAERRKTDAKTLIKNLIESMLRSEEA